MEFLFVSDLSGNKNSGAAGSLITIGNNLEKQGHSVDYIWKKEKRLIKNLNYYRFFELPFSQYKQIKAALELKEYDAVFISQPHAWYAVKRLKSRYPEMIFINRSHGWELRIDPITWSLEPISRLKKLFNKVTLFLLQHCSYLTVKHSDAILCASTDDARFIRDAYPRHKSKIYTINYGLDDEYLNIPLKITKPSKMRFLFVGQYIPRKGIKDLQFVFKALASRYSNFELTFIVNAESKSHVEADFGFIQPEARHVLPWMGREELIKLYQENDVFLMPSYGEGFGKTTLEAMACGLCAIGYKDGALTDLGKHLENALLVKVGDREGLLDCMEYALVNPLKVKAMGLQAYKDVQKLTWQQTSTETASLVANLLQNRKGRIRSLKQSIEVSPSLSGL